MRSEGQDEVTKYFPHMDFVVTDGQGSAAKQSSDVDDAVTRGTQVLLISPYQADALAPAIDRATAAGVKVITVDRNTTTKVLSFISPDDVANGEAVGKYLAARLNGKGKIIEVTGTPGASPTIARHDGFMKGIAGSPGISIIASQSGDYLRGPALTAMENILQRFPSGSFDAVYTHADEMAVGVVQALKEVGRDKEVFVCAINGEAVGLELIQKGDLAATAVYSTVAREGVIAAAKVLAGESIPARITMDSTLVTKDNVEQFIGKTW
jgi:ribose transport system substrate-binding protein